MRQRQYAQELEEQLRAKKVTLRDPCCSTGVLLSNCDARRHVVVLSSGSLAVLL